MDLDVKLFEQTINEILPNTGVHVRDVNLPKELAAVFNIQLYLSGAYSLGIKSVMHYSLSLVYYKIILSIFRLRRRAAQAPDRRA